MGQAGAESCPLKSAQEVAFFGGITQAGQPDVEPARAELIKEAIYVGRAAHRHDGDALPAEHPAASLRERLKRGLVARSLDKYDRPRFQAQRPD